MMVRFDGENDTVLFFEGAELSFCPDDDKVLERAGAELNFLVCPDDAKVLERAGAELNFREELGRAESNFLELDIVVAYDTELADDNPELGRADIELDIVLAYDPVYAGVVAYDTELADDNPELGRAEYFLVCPDDDDVLERAGAELNFRDELAESNFLAADKGPVYAGVVLCFFAAPVRFRAVRLVTNVPRASFLVRPVSLAICATSFAVSSLPVC
jgi:hypothetical protein